MKVEHRNRLPMRRPQAGVTLLETVIAMAILLIISAGILSLVGVAMTTTENQGHLAARTTEYAQDKMEQLMALNFNDGVAGGAGSGSDTTVASYVAANTGGNGLLAGGSLSTSAPTAGYVDYLDASGNPLGATSTNWFYERVWQITNVSATMKQITVRATVRMGIGGDQYIPTSTVSVIKTNPF
jgi:Prokaryotic N-terminal methylation motif